MHPAIRLLKREARVRIASKNAWHATGLNSTPTIACPCSASQRMSSDLPHNGTNTVVPAGASTAGQQDSRISLTVR